VPSIEFDDDRPPRSRDELLDAVRATGIRRRYRRRAAAGGVAAVLVGALLVPTLVSNEGKDARVIADADRSTTTDASADDTLVGGDPAAMTTTSAPQVTTSTTLQPRGTAPVAVTPLRGEHLAFSAALPGGESDIWAMNADGSGLRQLTRGPERDTVPVWSPDGKWIAYYAIHDGVRATLRVMRSGGADDRQVASGGDRASWAPDSRHLVDTNGDHRLVIVDIQTGTARELGEGPGESSMPSWSPRGDLIAFRCALDLCSIRPDGTGQKKLTEAAYEPLAWAPDGSRLAFGHAIGSGQSMSLGLHTIAADGSDLRRLTSYATNWTEWSPDGARIVYGGQAGLAVVNVDGTGDRPLDSGANCGQDPSWAPSSRTVALMCDPDTNHPAIHVVNADGSGRRRITDERFQLVYLPDFSPVTAPA
jgi:TolB protein